MSLGKRLRSAIKNKRSERAKSILENSQLCQSLDTVGASLLRHSAGHGNAELTKYLLGRGCDKFIDSQDSKGQTALIKATQGRHAEVIEVLLNAGADPLVSNHENKSALQMICSEDYLTSELRCSFLRAFRLQCSSSEEAAEKLMTAGCQLYQAVYSMDAEILECMLKRGVSSNSMISDVNITALHIAVVLEDVECAKVLLRHGADVEAVDVMGLSPLYYVYRHSMEHTDEKVEILRVLLSQSGSRVDVCQLKPTLKNGDSKAVDVAMSHSDFEGESKDNDMLHHLAANFNPRVVDVLKVHAHKLNVNALNGAGMSALQVAAINGHVELVDFLLNHGANVNHADHPHGRTALYYAYTRSTPRLEDQYHRCIELLLQHGADAQFISIGKGGERVTVFDVASGSRKFEPAIAQLAVIEERGAPITVTTRLKIDSHQKLKIHYDRCRRILRKEIEGNVTLLKLLTGSDRSLKMYAGNEDLVWKLKRISCKRAVRRKFPYYYDALVKRFSRGIRGRRLADAAAGVVCDIFGGRVDRTHVVVGRVNDYLSDRDLGQLCRV